MRWAYLLVAHGSLLSDLELMKQTMETMLLASTRSDNRASVNTAIEISSDAGRYLCNYVYYRALIFTEWLRRQESERRGRAVRLPNALFIHVPPEDRPFSVVKLGVILLTAVSSVATMYM